MQQLELTGSNDLGKAEFLDNGCELLEQKFVLLSHLMREQG